MIAGEKAPDFTLYDHTGRPRTVSALLSEGPVVLFFFPLASSPICTAQACHFRDLSNEFATVGAQRAGISTDTVEKQAHFAQQRSFDSPLLSDADADADADGVVSELFGVRRGRLAKLRKFVVAREAARREVLDGAVISMVARRYGPFRDGLWSMVQAWDVMWRLRGASAGRPRGPGFRHPLGPQGGTDLRLLGIMISNAAIRLIASQPGTGENGGPWGRLRPHRNLMFPLLLALGSACLTRS